MSSDSEDELLMPGGQWATDQNESGGEEEETLALNQAETASKNWDYVKKNKKDKKTPKRDIHDVATNEQSKTVTAPKSFSLHLTKVPFDATQSTIRCAFIEKNCRITSVRLVYDTDQKSRERKFRGVAFVDLEDEASYNIGLKQHNTAFLGGKRRVNVRPTKTRNELSEIVKKTEERVAALIARSKEKKRAREEEEGEKDSSDGGAAKPKKRKHNKNKKKGTSTGEGKSEETKTGHDNSKNQSKKHESSPRKSDEETKTKRRKSKDSEEKKSDGSPKLTKKQRAQKAAIIRTKKKR